MMDKIQVLKNFQPITFIFILRKGPTYEKHSTYEEHLTYEKYSTYKKDST